MELVVLGPWGASDSVSTTERNRRRPCWVVEDFATEERPKVARAREARMGSYSGAVPKVVRHARYFIFHMAEVAVPWALLGEIIERIRKLKVVPISPG